MKRTTTAVLFLMLATLASAQTATFTFGGLPSPFSSNQSRCTGITSWNGVAAGDPNNPYAQDMGSICLDIYPAVYTDTYIPFQLGFPNNGQLTSCSPTTWQPAAGVVISNGDGTGFNSFTASGCYDGGNTVINATVQYKQITQTFCGRYGCRKFTAWQVTGGSGTVSNE